MRSIAIPAESLSAARQPEFRFLWLANSLANFARWFEMAVLTWLALGLTGSPWLLAVIGFWRNIPLLPLGPFGGLLGDLFDRRALVIGTQLASAVVAFVVGVLLITERLVFEHLLITSAFLGLIAAVDWPCRRALLIDIVPAGNLVNAAALDSSTAMASRIFGPLLGGTLIALLGMGGCYLVLTIAYAAAGLAAIGMRPIPPQGRATVQKAIVDFREGVRYTTRRPMIYAMMAVTFLANLLPLAFLQFLPVFARDVLDLDPVRYGALGSAVGVGALASALVLAAQSRRWRPEPTFLAGAMILGVTLIPFALTENYLVALACLFLTGWGQGLYTSLQGPVILLRADAALRGRLMGILVCAIGIWPVGMLLMGALIERLGPAAALASAAGVFVLTLGALALCLPRLYAHEARFAALKPFDGQAGSA